MRRFFLFSVMYVAMAMVVLVVFRDNPMIQLSDAVTRTQDAIGSFLKYAPVLGVGFVGMFAVTRKFGGKSLMVEASYAFAACLLFQIAFTFIKTSIPHIQPFNADPFFAVMDKALHGGVDPWVWTHKFADLVPPAAVSTLYFMIWSLPALFLPFIIAVTDNDHARKQRFLILFGFVWIGLGNVLATIGSSAGPIYYDRLLGTERFPDLIAALGSSGIAASPLGQVQEGLWTVYSELSQAIGAGISAFPSVHVGVATMTMLYLFERSKWLAPVGIAFLAAIQFCSVYIGWHYAVDGYFSFVAVLAVWTGLRFWQKRRSSELSMDTATPA